MQLILFLLIISVACFGLQIEPFASWANWHRGLISDGQWWRIVTGNFTHTNYPHLAMNLAGLWIMAFIFRPSARSLALVIFVTSLAIGFANFTTHMTSYVGLSGVLHGIFAYYALNEALNGRRSSWWLVLGLIVKLVWEWTVGPAASTQALIQAHVAIEAHLFGALGGVGLAILSKLKTKF
ncbi:rhombosortase [Vibrio sinensis]|uniref:Rhombosortase n=1 Tax=Vibrio sinensis TaxID=2302434 RepID=A0A3A6QN19_9VIBR|nr:rhombosortase [Vibrio sinensis]RJX72006.1 rhombosortase [Vibrio sinensis]